MNFDLSEEQRIALDGLHRYLAAEIAPIVAEHANSAMPKAVVHDVFRKLAAYGLGSGWTSEEAGGLGLDLVTSGLLYEEVARVSSALAASVGVNDSVAMLIDRLGTPEHKARYLEGLLKGDLIAAIGVTEPDAGSDPSGLRTRAAVSGATLKIDGEKTWITNGGVCDLIVAACRDGEGVSLAIVERGDGFTSRELEKLGQKDQSSAQISFSEVEAPASRIIGGRGEGLKLMSRMFPRARALVAMFATGVARAALDAALAYAGVRKQWGKAIGAHQLVQAKLAEMATELDASRLLGYRALSLLQAGVRCDAECAMAKWYATEAAVRIASEAMQIHGAYGFSKEFPVERYFRDARMMTVPDGATEIQKLIIGRALTGIPAFS